MNLTEHFDKETTVNGVLVAFMEAIEEWQSAVEGSPSDDEMKELQKVYDIAEVSLRFIVNNNSPPTDDLPEPPSPSQGERELKHSPDDWKAATDPYILKLVKLHWGYFAKMCEAISDYSTNTKKAYDRGYQAAKRRYKK